MSSIATTYPDDYGLLSRTPLTQFRAIDGIVSAITYSTERRRSNSPPLDEDDSDRKAVEFARSVRIEPGRQSLTSGSRMGSPPKSSTTLLGASEPKKRTRLSAES